MLDGVAALVAFTAERMQELAIILVGDDGPGAPPFDKKAAQSVGVIGLVGDEISRRRDSLGHYGGRAMAVAAWSGCLLSWKRGLSALKARLAPVFGRKEVKGTAGAFLDGLLSGVERKTG